MPRNAQQLDMFPETIPSPTAKMELELKRHKAKRDRLAALIEVSKKRLQRRDRLISRTEKELARAKASK